MISLWRPQLELLQSTLRSTFLGICCFLFLLLKRHLFILVLNHDDLNFSVIPHCVFQVNVRIPRWLSSCCQLRCTIPIRFISLQITILLINSTVSKRKPRIVHFQVGKTSEIQVLRRLQTGCFGVLVLCGGLLLRDLQVFAIEYLVKIGLQLLRAIVLTRILILV